MGSIRSLLGSDSSRAFALTGIKGHSSITVYGVLPEPPPPNPSVPHPPLPSLPPTPATREFLLHLEPCIYFSFCPKHPDRRCLCSSPLPPPFFSAACSLLSCLAFYCDLWLYFPEHKLSEGSEVFLLCCVLLPVLFIDILMQRGSWQAFNNICGGSELKGPNSCAICQRFPPGQGRGTQHRDDERKQL